MIIRCKIDVTKIDKSALFEGKTGAKYLDLTLLENRNGPDKYGNDWMVTQDIGQERRKNGEKGPILGNGKNIVTGQQPRPAQQPKPDVHADMTPRTPEQGGAGTVNAPDNLDEDVPFAPFKF